MDDRVPDHVTAALDQGGAAIAFSALPPSHQRDYLTWIAEARRPETRARHIAQTVERLGGGKDNR